MFTEQKGHQTFIINSVRKVKASTPSSFLQLLSLVEIVAYHQDHRKIHRIKEVRLEYPWQSIPFDMRKSSVATCIAEICSKCITTADPHPELFNFLHESLVLYDQPPYFDRDFLIRFLVGLSHFLGFGLELPDQIPEGSFFDLLEGHLVREMPLSGYVIPGDDLRALSVIMQKGAKDRAEIDLQVRRRLIDQLVLYYQLHVDTMKEVNSLRILRELQ